MLFEFTIRGTFWSLFRLASRMYARSGCISLRVLRASSNPSDVMVWWCSGVMMRWCGGVLVW